MMVVGSLAFGQVASINWISLEEAVAAQQKEPRKIMMDVYTKWCGPCKMMMANTFTNATTFCCAHWPLRSSHDATHADSNHFTANFDSHQ